jgi:multidrug efflux pump subunit AcrB
MKALITYFFRYPVAADLLTVGFLLAGWAGLGKITSNFFPETDSKIIIVQLVYPGASPEEIEEGIVVKIEDNLKGVAGIDNVKSVSRENSASVTIEVTNADETDEILQDVKNAVDRISSFPVGMEPPIIFKQDQINFAISFAVSGEVDLRTLKRYARQIETELRSKEIISQVELSGFPEEEIEVGLDEDKMRAMGLSFNEVATAIRSVNLETTGGKIRGPVEELVIRGRFKEYYAADLADLVVRAESDGSVVRLGEIATLTDKWAEDDASRSSFNGKPSAVITVNNLIGEDMLSITDEVNRYISRWNEAGKEVRLHVIRDGSVVLRQRMDLLISNGIAGFLLVLLVLALFLNFRIAFWVASSIPVSFAAMFIVAEPLGITINVISLFGMILVVGILVDDGIVIAENIYAQHEKGKSRMRAAIEGTLEVLPSVVSAVLTTIVAFMAFFFIEGRLGDVFSEMALVVILTLLFSLVEAAVLLPAHIGHSKALDRNATASGLEKFTKGLLSRLKDGAYAPAMKFALRHRLFSFFILVSLFVIIVIGGIGSGIVKTTFFPFIESDNINITLNMFAGTREHVTEATLDRMEQAVWEVNAELKSQRSDGNDVVLAIDRRQGPLSSDGSLNVILLDGETRNMRQLEITSRIRNKIGPVYGAENLTFGNFSPFGKAVSVSLLGNDRKELSSAVTELKSHMQGLSDIKDVVDNDQEGLKEISVELNPNARALGLNEQEVLAQLRQGFFGLEVQRLQRGIDEVKVWLRYGQKDRAGVGNLEDLRIRAADGSMYPLSEVADLSESRGLVAINHLYGEREIQVSADIAGPSVSAAEVMAKLRKDVVPAILSKYPSVRASFEGQNREQVKSQKSIGAVMPAIFAIMLFMIILTFRSFAQGVLVFLLIPFGLIGVTLGHWVHGVQISLFSILGMVALIGILVNDALVFVAAFNQNMKEGMKVKEAIIEAGLSRFRPILLTSVTTIAGLAPLILNKSFQAQFLIPMAISVAWGLLVITLVTLLILPVFIMALSDLRVFLVRIWSGKKIPGELLEPGRKEALALAHEDDDEDA